MSIAFMSKAVITCRCRRRAFSLIELTATAAISGILVVGIASAVVVGTRALPQNQTSSRDMLNATEVAEQISNELHYALSIENKSATSIRFTVPDRDGDNDPEAIEYVWSGTAGDSLIRKFSGQNDQEILKDTREFALSYECKTVTIPGSSGTSQESADMLLIQQTSANSGTAASYSVQSANWCGAYFRPTFAAGVTSWRITQVKILASPHSTADGRIRVQIRPSDFALRPTPTILEEVTHNESTFVNGSWLISNFSNVGNLTVGTGYCVTIRHDFGGGTVASIAYGTSSSLSPNTNFNTSTNTGGSWTPAGSNDLWMEVYGRVTQPGLTTPDTYRYWLKKVNIGLRAGRDAANRVDTGIQVLNQPEISSP